jgi:hypothetical protein
MGNILPDVARTGGLSAARERVRTAQDLRRGALLATGRLANVCSNDG